MDDSCPRVDDQADAPSESETPQIQPSTHFDYGSAKPQKLMDVQQANDGRLRLVTTRVYNIESLWRAISSVDGVFAITSKSHPDKLIIDEGRNEHEIEVERNTVRAVKEGSIQHFVFSNLPDVIRTTSGWVPKVFHINNKYYVRRIARKELPGRETVLIARLSLPESTKATVL